MTTDISGNGYYVVTTLMESLIMGRYMTEEGSGVKYRVFLKLENTQPTQSFKLRGISNLMLQEHGKGATGFVASSGGNAGLAASYVALKLRLPLRVFVPCTIKQPTIDKLKNMGAEVEVVDGEWEAVDGRARKESQTTNHPYIHPFDHPLLWEGHASMIEESRTQMGGLRPDVVVVSVGGGGLLLGVAEGMRKVGWSSVPIVAMETEGTSSFNQSLRAGRLVTLEKINGIASSLGATRISAELLEVSKKRRVVSRVVTDRQCVQAISAFLDDHLMLVEPACGASLAAAYCSIINEMVRDGTIQCTTGEGKGERTCNVLIIVCGGKVVSHAQLDIWKQQFSV